MNQQAIFGPFFATIMLTLVVWVYMYARRIPFIVGHQLGQKELAVPGALARLTPAAISNPSGNLKNLFEMPVLFYALVLYLFTTQHVDAQYVGAAWMFFVFRALHSLVHCTFNLVTLRFALYACASAAAWFMLLRAAFSYFFALVQ